MYNEAMKDFFSQYKFQGDYALYSVFTEVLQKELKDTAIIRSRQFL